MADVAKIFRINYKSDFILTLTSDAGWMTPFCIKFWTGAPSQAYYVSWDGETYNHCSFDPSEPTKLLVQFDDHHLPIGNLKFQVAYHFTVADFPNDTEDEVINPANITTEIDGETYQVMLDFTGETAPEIQFALPAYANEAQRIDNEQQRIAAETQRIANEETRIQHEESRIAAEQTRQQNEQQRINQEQARVNEYASLKADAVAATGAANDAAALANQKAQLAADKAALAQAAADLANAKAQLAADKAALAASAAQLANDKAALAQQKAEYAQTQGGYAKDQGDYAKDKGDICSADHLVAVADHGIAVDDHTQASNDHTRAESDHGIAVDDHTQAGNDHTRAESDHGIAADDHTQAGTDHQTAAADHQTATADHTQAGNDHTRAESDHTRAESDHAAVEVYVDSLGAFDISAYHATGGVLAKYADLTAALGTNGANVPDALRKGGMSVKFVQSYDNKYARYNLLADSFTTDVTQWAIDDAGVYVENPEFIRVVTDNEGRILYAVKADGGIYYGAGVPQQIIDYVTKYTNASKEELLTIINTKVDTKVDKEEGKSLIDAEYASGIQFIENPEFVTAYIDHDNKIIFGIKADGDVYFGYGIPSQIKDYVYTQILSNYNSLKEEVDGAVENMQEQVEEMLEDAEDTLGYFESKENPEWLSATTDNEGKVIDGIKKDFTRHRYRKTFEKEINVENAEVKNLKVTDKAEFTDKIISEIHSNNINDGSVRALYPKYEWEGYLANLATTKNLGVLNDRTYKPLVLLHFSDIHNDAAGFKRVLDFNSMYKKYIDNVLLSGDIAGGDWQSYSSSMTNLKGFYDVLKIIGNHDVYNYGGTSGLTATEAQCFARYMQGIENWGVQYTNDVCYWYKDYVHNTGTKDNFNGSAFDNTVNYTQGSLVIYDNKYYKAKGPLAAGEFNLNNWVEITSFGIRLIGWDFMHRSAAQQSWLVATLADALTKGLSVIITTHGTPYLNDNTAAYFDTPFDSHDEWQPKAKNTSMTPSDVIEAVSNFIDNGGEFICYLSGHIHTDKCGYFKAGSAESGYAVHVDDDTYYYNKYKQVFIVIGLAKTSGDVIYDYESDGQPELDIQKIAGTKTLDLFNIESFDTETKTISVLRVGCDIDRLLRSRRSMVIDYKNSELLYSR